MWSNKHSGFLHLKKIKIERFNFHKQQSFTQFIVYTVGRLMNLKYEYARIQFFLWCT